MTIDSLKDEFFIFIARDHTEYEIPQTKIQNLGDLHIFYDKPIMKNGRWDCARKICDVDRYMFPNVKDGECLRYINF